MVICDFVGIQAANSVTHVTLRGKRKGFHSVFDQSNGALKRMEGVWPNRNVFFSAERAVRPMIGTGMDPQK